MTLPIRGEDGQRALIAMERIVRELRKQFHLRPGDVSVGLRPKLYLAFLLHTSKLPNGKVALVPEVPFYGIVVRATEWPIYSGS